MTERYNAVLVEVLGIAEDICEKMKKEVFIQEWSKFLLKIPEKTEVFWHHLKTMCEGASSPSTSGEFGVFLGFLKDNLSQVCETLDIGGATFLSMIKSRNEEAATLAIRMACMDLFPIPQLASKVFEYAVADLRSLADLQDEEEMDAGKVHSRVKLSLTFAVKWQTEEVLENYNMFKEFVALYPKCKPAVQKEFLLVFSNLVAYLSSKSAQIYQFLESSPEDCDELVLQTIQTLAKKKQMDPKLVELIISLSTRSSDIKYVIPLLPLLDLEAQIKTLLSITQTNHDQTRTLVEGIFKVLIDENRSQSAVGLLVTIHKIDYFSEPREMKDVIGTAINLFLDEHYAMNDRNLSDMFEALFKLPELPALVVRSMILALERRSSIKAASAKVIRRPNVWENSAIWKGIPRLLEALPRDDVTLLDELPHEKKQELLDKSSALQNRYEDRVERTSDNGNHEERMET
eukprot:CAMPEP_0115046634 /NCGR_PEP_ID=MMETSP0216-20121206/48852_1 /TAXON_ID=223996 /ORGANISM="Protocruzia adherens, Strain Boccale" /LENGTH=459 /DNA_ID=CAMNT_0002429725 /DNA_START=249 /DNA_END=1630 /DNA_ORIENTATION=-